jgi:cellulose synthase/poly-beta-1,6-N-acetylglucosamine synthase-like glycosyltransferase
MGGNGQFTRMSVLDEIAVRYGHPWDDALLEDYELGLRVLLAGHRNAYCHDTYVAQEAVTSLRRLLAQRTRWSQGNIQCTRYIPQIMRCEYLSNAGVLECLYYLVLPFVQLLGLLVWPAVYVAFATSVIADSQQALATLTSLWWLLLLVGVLGIMPFVLWGPVYRRRCEPAAPWWMGIIWGLGLWLYVYYMYISVARAFIRVVTGRRGWVKTPRNAEPSVGGQFRKETSGAGSR